MEDETSIYPQTSFKHACKRLKVLICMLIGGFITPLFSVLTVLRFVNFFVMTNFVRNIKYEHKYEVLILKI